MSITSLSTRLQLTMKMLLGLLFCCLVGLCWSYEYDPVVSKQMRMYSLIAHCSQQQISDWKCPLCSQTEQLQDLQYLENQKTSVMGYGGYLKSLDKIFWVFRGTINLTNWLEDFSYHQVSYPRCSGCKIHQGFYLAYLSISSPFLGALHQLTSLHPGAPLVITGCSMGAALATIAAIEVNSIFGPVEELHTYGSPRVGDDGFSSFVSVRLKKIWRVVHNRDLVPHVPLVSQNYHHVPREVLFDEEMRKFEVCEQTGEDPGCSDKYYPNYNVDDHLNYWVKLDPAAICNA